MTCALQAVLGVGSVTLPGATITKGATIGCMVTVEASTSVKPGFIHMGSPATAIVKAGPEQDTGETPEGFVRSWFAILPVVQVAVSMSGVAFSLAAAASFAWWASSAMKTDSLVAHLCIAAISVAIMTTALPAAGFIVKKFCLGQLREENGINKYSPQNLARTVLSAVDSKALDIWGEAARGSPWFNSVLRSRGLSIGHNVYLDTNFPGDYELVSYSDEVVVDRDALIFAHLGHYKGGKLQMTQKSVCIGDQAIIESRSVMLPGSSLVAQGCLKSGQVYL